MVVCSEKSGYCGCCPVIGVHLTTCMVMKVCSFLFVMPVPVSSQETAAVKCPRCLWIHGVSGDTAPLCRRGALYAVTVISS